MECNSVEWCKNRYEQQLLARNIKPTAIRILILKEVTEIRSSFSLADLEERLDTVDKSTIFRTLTIFHEHHLIHTIDDGSGSLKYSLCEEGCDCSLNKLHVHFYCNECKHTFCIRNVSIPSVPLPEGFSTESINYVMKGTCSNCAK